MVRKILNYLLKNSSLSTEAAKIKHLISRLDQESENTKMTLGKLHSKQVKSMEALENIQDAEFKIFSQWGDDGIIQYLINKIEIPNKTFIEFGVENYYEANTRFLLMNDNWSGLVMDGSVENVKQITNSEYYWKYDLTAINAFIDLNNVEGLINSVNWGIELGILSIDIDGNDYWIWEKIKNVNPIIVIIEYNSVLGIDKAWSVPYDDKFSRTQAHFSNLYYGASLLSLCDLAEEKGYYFVGCNSAGNNAYFVRKDKIGNIKILRPEEGYVTSKFKESRDENGKLTYLKNIERIQYLKGFEIINTRTRKTERI